MTEDQRRAIQAFVHSAIVPLIEDVIVKKLGQAAIVLRDELATPAQPKASEPAIDPKLCEFYDVDSWPALVAAQEEHVLKLQDAARRNVKPWEDTFPPTLLPKYLRDTGLDAAEPKVQTVVVHVGHPKASEETGPEAACYQAYQAVGVMLSDLGLFDTERGQKLLDNLSQARVVHDDVLPWESASEGKAGGEDAMDAARYRWLAGVMGHRLTPELSLVLAAINANSKPALDAAIDAAMTATLTATLTAPGADDGQ